MLALEPSRIKFSKVKVCAAVEYGPNEGDGEEGDMFCNNMYRTLDSVVNGYRCAFWEI